MSSRSSSPSVSSNGDSDFSFPEDRSDDIGEGEEVAAYEESSMREEKQPGNTDAVVLVKQVSPHGVHYS